MNSSVTPAVTTPSAMPAWRAGRLNWDGRGRTMTRRMTAAQNSLNHAAPVAPTWSTSPTDTASPSWTQSIDTVAMEAPMRADDLDMTPVNAARTFAST